MHDPEYGNPVWDLIGPPRGRLCDLSATAEGEGLTWRAACLAGLERYPLDPDALLRTRLLNTLWREVGPMSATDPVGETGSAPLPLSQALLDVMADASLTLQFSTKEERRLRFHRWRHERTQAEHDTTPLSDIPRL